MKGFFAKLKDFSSKLKVSEILLSLKSQNRWKKPIEGTGTYIRAKIMVVRGTLLM